MNSAEKLRLLRRRMQEQGMDAYVVVTDDFHGSEYVGDYFKAREYLSGFTGSAGTLVVLPDSAALWTDGRYFLQAADQLAGSTIDLMRAGQPGVPTIGAFLAQRVPQGGTVGFDGRTVSSLFARTMAAALEGKNVRFTYEQDLAGAVWPDRAALSAQPVWELPAECAGLTREEKLRLLREKMRETGAEVLVLTALDEVAWTLNLRGDDVRCTPVFLSFLLLRQEEATLCVQEQILSGELKEKLAACGVALGIMVHTSAAMLGISAVIAQSVTLFTLLRYAGAAYLCWMGFHALRAGRQVTAAVVRHGGQEAGAQPVRGLRGRAFRQGFLTNALNPKAVLFFLTMLPQFLDPHAALWPQFLELGGIMAFFCLGWFVLLASLLHRIRRLFVRPAFQAWLHRLTGLIFIGFAFRLALEKL